MIASSPLLVHLFQIFEWVVDLYLLCVMIYAVISWLVTAKVVDASNDTLQKVWGFLRKIVEPALTPIRNFVKPVNGYDLSPVALTVIIWVLNYILVRILF